MKRSKSNRPKQCPFVGKGGLKLLFALEHFDIRVDGLVVADLGCNVGGFTDCLLQYGAQRVYAVDTAYGLLAWKLRSDTRVIVFERTNALHWQPPELMDLVLSDLGWTKQEKSLPVIASLVKPGGQLLALIKPQYEAPRELLVKGVLPERELPNILESVIACVPNKYEIQGIARSPYLGHGGNAEYWLFIRSRCPDDS